MNNCALICEYNPFHSGHKYQLDTVRSLGFDNIVCIMSGSFTQSGMPAFCDKTLRAECALFGGSDAVIELPAVYATASAHDFALGGVKIASQIKNTTALAMGATGRPDDILRIAEIKTKHAQEIETRVKTLLDTGKSYNYALFYAIAEVFGEIYPDKNIVDIIEEPNNMLCIEYISAITELGSTLNPVIIKRKGALHGSTDTDALHISATAIREQFDSCIDNVRKYLPYNIDKIAAWRNAHKPDLNKYDGILLYALKSQTPDTLKNFRDCASGMEYLLCNNGFGTVQNYIDNPQLRRYGKKRLYRLMVACALGIEKRFASLGFCTRLLACKKKFDHFILPSFVKSTNSEIKSLIDSDAAMKKVLQADERATLLYNTLCAIDGGYYNYSLVKI